MTNGHPIKLRAMEPEDLDLLYMIENDPQLWDVGTTNVPYSRYLLHDYIASCSGDIYTDLQVRLIVENEEGETVGLVDLMNFDARNCRAEVGIVIARQHRQRGYARQTLVHIANYARKTLHLHQLYAIIDTTNLTALQLFTNAGYSPSSQLTDWLYDGKEYRHAMLMQFFL